MATCYICQKNGHEDFECPGKQQNVNGKCGEGCIKTGKHDTCHVIRPLRGLNDIDPVKKELSDAQEFLQGGVTVSRDSIIAQALGGSVKHDEGKYDPTMLTQEMVELVSRVRMFGAKKYARNNFKKTGFKYTRSLAAALRHIFAFLNGEDNDPESGLSHLGHAICCLEHCIYDTKHHPQNDDRKAE